MFLLFNIKFWIFSLHLHCCFCSPILYNSWFLNLFKLLHLRFLG